MLGYLLAAGAYVGTSLLKHSWNPLHWLKGHAPTAVTTLSPGLVYALNVLTNASVDATQVQNGVNQINGGNSFTSAGRLPAKGKLVTSWPGVVLTGNAFNGSAQQWIVYVVTKAPIVLPVQPNPTLLITAAFRTA